MPTPDYAKLAKTHIWYVCYGSNLTWDRFKYYVQGGLCPFNGREYPGCADKTAPVESRAVHVPFDLYFGGSAQIWEGGGVGFLDASRPGDALARAVRAGSRPGRPCPGVVQPRDRPRPHRRH